MSATAVCDEQVTVRRERRPCSGPRGVTLGQLLERAHEAVHAGQPADCPVCGGVLRAVSATTGRCDSCGTAIS